jgi:Na+/melibiose symporter-like transporter
MPPSLTPFILADYPAGTLTSALVLFGTAGVVLLCLLVAYAMRTAEDRRAARNWLIAAGACIVISIISLIIVHRLGLP